MPSLTRYEDWTASLVEAADAAARVTKLLSDVKGPTKYTSRQRAAQTDKIELITKLLEEATTEREKGSLKKGLAELQTSLTQIGCVTNTERELIIPYAEAINRLKATLDTCQKRIADIQSGYERHHGMEQAAEQLSIQVRPNEPLFFTYHSNTAPQRLVGSPPHINPKAQQQPDCSKLHRQLTKIANLIALQDHRSVEADDVLYRWC